MPRYGGGGGGGGGSRSGGYKSSSSKSSSSSGSRTFKTKDPNAPEKVVVRYPGGLHRTFASEDCETAEFQSQIPSGYIKHDPFDCKEILACAIQYTLYEGSDSGEIFRRILRENCGGIVLDFDEKKGSATTSSVPN